MRPWSCCRSHRFLSFHSRWYAIHSLLSNIVHRFDEYLKQCVLIAFHLPSRIVRRNLHRMWSAFVIAHILVYIAGIAGLYSVSIWNVIYGILIALFLLSSLMGCQLYIRTILLSALKEPQRLNADQLKSLLRIQIALKTVQIVTTICILFAFVITTIFFYDYRVYPTEAIITDAPAYVLSSPRVFVHYSVLTVHMCICGC
jgi:lysylphosphatidylglycerol synthetase-like protein (DUF2156 family)